MCVPVCHVSVRYSGQQVWRLLSLSLWTERRMLAICFVIQMPNVSPAKQLPPCYTELLSLSHLPPPGLVTVLFGLLLLSCFRSFLVSLFVVVLFSPSLCLIIFIFVSYSICSTTLTFFSVLVSWFAETVCVCVFTAKRADLLIL